MPDSVTKPAPEGSLVKEDILQANSIEVRVVQEGRLVVLPVKNSKPHDWECRENQVVATVQQIVVDKLSGEFRHNTKAENWNHIEHILVEHVADQVRVAAIGLATVDKQ